MQDSIYHMTINSRFICELCSRRRVFAINKRDVFLFKETKSNHFVSDPKRNPKDRLSCDELYYFRQQYCINTYLHDTHLLSECQRYTCNLSNIDRVMKKPAFYICENRGPDELRDHCIADQGLCFRYIDSKSYSSTS